MKRAIYGIAVLLTVLAAQMISYAAPSVDGKLIEQIFAAPFGLTPAVVTFDHQPNNADFAMLQSLGVTGGYKMRELPMVLTRLNSAQLNALKQRPEIVSIYANHTFRSMNNESRKFIGVEKLLADPQVKALNNSLPVTGKNIGIAYVDTGIDATHPDLKLGENVAQNVLFPAAEAPLNFPSAFVPVLPLENQPMTDVEGGHGTFGAGVTAGTGAASGGFYRGVAPGAKLVGLTAGNDAGLSTFAIVQALDYALATQFLYNIRVCNNSYGTTLADYPYNPNDPINTATRLMHDRNIAVVFAAGNDGDAPDVINPFSVAPWVISVAAGEKRGLGTPAGFSSRGNDNGTGTDTPGQPADPNALPNLRPDITGSGVDIKSTRSKGPGVTNVAGSVPLFVGANDLTTIAPAYLPYYTTSQGTSFSTPQVSGVIALMLETNPFLTPDEIVTILRQTATPMPYEERVVGAGYVDAHNAVRRALALSAVVHPANLFPTTDPNAPQITDVSDDQLGTTAQDIIEGKFAYDSAANQIVYTLTVADLSVKTPNMRWTMTSRFGSTDVFVTASSEELATTFKYGKITTLATGTKNQETLGTADSGALIGNQIIVRLSLDKINAAVSGNILGTTSTNTQAQTQILIGSSLSGGLLLNSDSANGSDFEIKGNPTPTPTPTPTATPTPTPMPTVTPTPTPTPEVTPTPTPSPTATPTPNPTPSPNPTPTPTPSPNPTPTPTPSPTPSPTPAPTDDKKFDERYSGTFSAGQNNVRITFEVRRSTLEAQINHNHGGESVYFELLDANGNRIGAASDKKLEFENLPFGTYYYRVYGNVSRQLDFTIKSTQGK